MKRKVLATLDVSTKKKGLILLMFTLFFLVSLLSYSSSDNCINVVSSFKTKNLLSMPGAIISDICYQYFGISIFFFFPFAFYLSYQYIAEKRPQFVKSKVVYTIVAVFCINFIISCCAGNYQNKFIIPITGRIGVLITSLIPTFTIKILLFIISTLIVFLYVYLIFFFRKQKIHLLRKKKFNSSSLSFNKKITNKNIFFKTILFTITIPIKVTIKIINTISSIIMRKKNKNVEKLSNNKTNENKAKELKVQERQYDQKTYHYNKPTTDLLKIIDNKISMSQSNAILKNNLEKLSKILGDFGVRGDMIGYKSGPIVTLYEFKPQAGIKASRIIGLSEDIARTMMVSSVRTATISGRDTLGIEVPNKSRECVCFRKLVESQEYQQSSANIPMILGCNIFGKPIIADLTDMPHLLIAGTTGSGKSVGINGMILSILYKLSPEECRLIMIDPKMLEFSAYEGIPHLMLPVITDAKNAVLSLKWVVKEMENRYRIMSEAGVRNINGYNQKIKELPKKKIVNENDENIQPMQYIVVIIDEMADLMVVAGKEIEILVQRLSQMARAAGIHLIMATQRPSVDVITGVIKANFPTRISYHVTSKIDSRTILGEQGAEQLLGKGDMLFMFGGTKTLRVHGPLITDEEVENVVKYLKDNNELPEYITLISDDDTSDNFDGTGNFGNDNDNILYKQAVKIVISEKKTSISYIQRKLRIGYNKAANFIEKMEQDGILSAPDVSGKRMLIKENNN